MPAADVGTGTTITWGTSSFTANVTGVRKSGESRPSVDTTHMSSTSRTFMPGDLVDYGSIEVDIEYDPDQSPPITAAIETFTITFPLPAGQSTAGYLAGTGFITDQDVDIPLEDKMTASFTLKWSGIPALTVSVT